MKTTNLVRSVCILLAWYSVGAVELQARAQVPTGDNLIQVHTPSGVRGPGIPGCFVAKTAPFFNVMFQSLKTSDGSEYTRQLVTTADLPCFTRNTTKALTAATSIATCAEATAREGLNSFMWEGGACTAYLAWRPRTRADCREGGSKVVYVVKKQLKPFSGGELVASGAIRYEGPNIYVDVSSHYDYCGFGSAVAKGYKLRWNGTEELTLPEGTTTHNLGYKILSLSFRNVSLWSIDADRKDNSAEFVLDIVRAHNHWYGLSTGAFIYISPTSNTYNGSIDDCSSWGLPSLFSEKADGEAASFRQEMDNFNIPTFFVGLQYIGSNWIWTGGLVQPNVDAQVWRAPQTTFVDNCAAVEGPSEDKAISPNACDAKLNVVCYVPPSGG